MCSLKGTYLQDQLQGTYLHDDTSLPYLLASPPHDTPFSPSPR
jgi:hypothetical protein